MRRAVLVVALAIFSTGCDSRQPAPATTSTPTPITAIETVRLQPNASRTYALRASVTVRGPQTAPTATPAVVSGN